MGISDPVFYPARGGSAEALRQNIWRVRIDLEDALSELLRRFDPREWLRRRPRDAASGTAARRARWRLAAYGLVAVMAVAATPPPRRRWVIVGLTGVAGLAAGAAAVTRRRLASARKPRDRAPAGADHADQRPDPTAVLVAGDVIDVLVKQHRRVEAAFAHVLRARGKERFDAFAALVELLNLHEHAEREVVHPALAALGGDDARAARDRLAEESAADLLMGRLISIGVDDPAFTRQCVALRDMVRAHAAREEGEEFPRLRDRLPGGQLRSMANQVRAAQSEPW